MNLKIGGSNVGKIMYNGQEFGGATKLEPGTILYISGQYVSKYNNELSARQSTAEITFPSAGKHWENLKNIRIYYRQQNAVMNTGQVFDINSIDEQTQSNSGLLTIRRERSLTDEADKLLVKTSDYFSDLVMIAVA